MPIHDLGYRAWSGLRGAEMLRWPVIAQNGFLRAWNNRWLRRLMILAWVPATYFGVVFFFYERALLSVENERAIEIFKTLIPADFSQQVDRATEGDPVENRHYLWTQLLFMFFRYPQAVLMVLVVGLAAPPLIARDVGSKAFLVYFSRPISRVEYILGKSATVWGYLLLITTAPALALYALAVALSPSVEVVAHTWDIPLRVLAASVVLIIPTTSLALAFSSLTKRAVTAGFLWYAVWVLGGMAYAILQANAQSEQFLQQQQDLQQQQAEGAWGEVVEAPQPQLSRWAFVSLFHTLGLVQGYVFDPDTGSSSVAWAAVGLTVLTVVSLLVTYWRVSSPMRV
ncbi:MAG: ABC transporter permease subunit [Pirellulaceae bacterium]